MSKPVHSLGTLTARLACGCIVGFRAGVEGSPVTGVIEHKSATCGIAIHVGELPVYDHREAQRPATRPLDPAQADFEEEN
jgi:hypothetical protein